jgi:sterol desaturase/sphingolipid hydroxylase (fatty acid hydroxylase superfamily)
VSLVDLDFALDLPQSGVMKRAWDRYFKIHMGTSRAEQIFFRSNHPIVPSLIFGGMSLGYIFLVQRFHPFTLAGLLGSLGIGVLLWTLVEYSLHRFMFHYSPKREPWRTIFGSLHLEHHRDTQNPGLILAPPTASCIYSLLIFAILFAVTWNWALSLLFLAGINLGYIFYEWIHYGVHCFNWNRGLLGYYKRNHFHHHFKEADKRFGITSPLWDHLFRTHVRLPKHEY